MPYRRRAKRGRNDMVIGIALAVVGLFLIAGLAFGAWWLRNRKEPLDAENCPRSGPKAVHVIMIDRSDPITEQQAQQVRQQIEHLKIGAVFGARFDIYTFEGDVKHEMRPIVRVCAPGRPNEANELIENPVLVRQQYEERFAAVLDRTTNDLMQESTRNDSPIVESLRAASITSFGPITQGTIPLHLTLVSDMVQNTSAISHFKTEPNFSLLSKSAAWPSLRPNFKGADVDILYLLRPNAMRGTARIQNRGHQLFWEQLIEGSGGRVISIRPL